ncbi:hypothetical protein KSP35_09775 [Aquihabitans sp. G128]|uniref:hypothetical protein n=1 Tax=Aquihabitans sp. G128 TaxID=2849779 RepID=UPI001C225E21|nr:hypothetical protein [Aquihabitans sp. G128]QXC63037.1 hypothetical protein KSP35_09775 [Aquihabitans sp. G128]
MRGGGGSGLRAGCMGFSLIGVLVVVALTFWLGSKALDSTGGAPERSSTSEAQAATTTSPTPTTAGFTVAIDVEPRTGLRGDDRVVVTSDAFSPGEDVVVATCTKGTAGVTAAPVCDGPSAVEATADAQGHLAVDYVVPRVVGADEVPFDCAQQAGLCRVTVRSSRTPTEAGFVALEYASDLGSPEITLPN